MSSEMENFHRSKIDKVEIWKRRLQKKIKTLEDIDIPILLQDGIQSQQTFYVSKPLHCFMHTGSTTSESYYAHYGAGPDNCISTWTQEINESKIRKYNRPLDCRIKTFVYVASNHVVFASCDDLSVRIFGSHFREHSKLQLQYSILSLLYEEKINIITGCVGKVQRWKLDSCLHKPPLLLQEVELHDRFSNITPWLSFLHYFTERNQIVALCGTCVFFLDAYNLEEVMFLENRHSFPLTACIAFSSKQYFITASKRGEIKTWNMSMNSFPYVGSFKGHMKRVISLAIHPVEKLLISSSEDSTIRLWRMETFRETYRFDVLDAIISASLINAKTFIYTSKRSISLLNLNLFHSLYTLIGSKLTDISLINPISQPPRIFAVAEDGGARVISPVHGNILTMVFPIVTHKPILYKHDPVEENVYVLLEKGNIMVISSKTNPCSVKYLWTGKHSDDAIVCFDVAFIKKAKTSVLLACHVDGVMSALRCQGYTLKKISPNRGLITAIKMCEDPTMYDFATFSTENTITLYKFSVDTQAKEIIIKILYDIQLNEKPDHIALLSNTIALATGKKLSFYKCKKEKKNRFIFQEYRHTKDEGHSSDITYLTSCPTLQIFASAAGDGRVKIWGKRCDLLRELSFDNTLSGICFLNKRGDLLVGFQNNLHYVNGLDYLPNNKLDLLSVSTITDEQMEYCIPFDPLLKFWYDANRVRTVRTMPIEAEEKKLCVEESAIYLEAITNKDLGHAHLVTSGLKKLRHSVFVLRALGNKRDQKSRIEWQKSMEKILNDTESENIDICEKHNKVPSNENIIDSLAELILQNELLNSTRSDNKTFWPCAPDGFIPNSVVRDRVQPKPSANKVLPWKPRTKVFKSEPTFEDFIEEDDDFDQTRTWLSGDDEEDDDFMFYDEWPDFKTKYTAKKITSGKKSLKKKEKRVKEKASTEEKIKPVIKKENKTAKLKDIKHKQKIVRAKPNTKRDGDQTQNISIADRFLPSPNTDSNDEFQVPPPYDKYFDENWFPTDIGFDANIITRSLLGKIQHIPPFSLRDLLDCIVDIHKSKHLSDDVFNHVINNLFDLLEHPSGQIRHYAVRTLLSLGANKKEVVLKLVPKLGDPVEAVREQVKIALEEMAGIRDADTLVQTLKDFGEYRETELSDDREVIESLKLAIVERGDILRQKMSMFSERDARLTEAMRKFNEPSKYAIHRQDRHVRKRKQSHKEHLDVLHRPQQQSLSNRTFDEFVDSKKNILIDVPEIRAPTNGDNGDDDTTAECFNVNTVLNGNIVEEEIYEHTDKHHLSIDHAHNKPLFTQKSKHLYQLHELLCETTEDTAEDALLSLAPHIYERFNNLTPENNLMKKIVGAKEISTPLGENAMAELAIKQMQVDFTQALNEKLEKLYQEDCTTTTNEKETPPHKNHKAKNYAKAVVLAVAFSALQARRCNNNDLQHHGLLGNETLYHLTMLLSMFQSRKRIKSSILSEISKVAFDMKNGFAASTSQDNEVMKHVVKQNPSNHNYPGVNSEEELVQGVCGERIMKRIYYVTKCSPLNKFTQIRSLPERNGNFTVNMHHGVTRYGAMRCDWTTLTPSYILSTTKHRALMKERSIINQKIYESKMKNAKNTLALHLRKRLSPVNRLNNTPVDRGKDSALLNKHPVLPRIERTPVRDVHSNIDKSKSGTALRLIRQVDFV